MEKPKSGGSGGLFGSDDEDNDEDGLFSTPSTRTLPNKQSLLKSPSPAKPMTQDQKDALRCVCVCMLDKCMHVHMLCVFLSFFMTCGVCVRVHVACVCVCVCLSLSLFAMVCCSAAAFGENGALDSKEDNLFVGATSEVSDARNGIRRSGLYAVDPPAHWDESFVLYRKAFSLFEAPMKMVT